MKASRHSCVPVALAGHALEPQPLYWPAVHVHVSAVASVQLHDAAM